MRKSKNIAIENNTVTYNQGDKVLLKIALKTNFNQNTYLGPYVITTIKSNGTVSDF